MPCGVAATEAPALRSRPGVIGPAVAGNLGFRTYLVGDATTTFDRVGPDGRRHRAEEVHAISLASLHGEFATVVDTAAVLRSVGEGPAAGAPAASPGQ